MRRGSAAALFSRPRLLGRPPSSRMGGPEADARLDFASDRFDAALALRSDAVALPCADARPLDNLSKCRYLVRPRPLPTLPWSSLTRRAGPSRPASVGGPEPCGAESACPARGPQRREHPDPAAAPACNGYERLVCPALALGNAACARHRGAQVQPSWSRCLVRPGEAPLPWPRYAPDNPPCPRSAASEGPPGRATALPAPPEAGGDRDPPRGRAARRPPRDRPRL